MRLDWTKLPEAEGRTKPTTLGFSLEDEAVATTKGWPDPSRVTAG
jgi:hypothetical protein